MTIWDIDLGWFVLLALAALFGGMIVAERLCYTAKKAEAAMDALDNSVSGVIAHCRPPCTCQ